MHFAYALFLPLMLLSDHMLTDILEHVARPIPCGSRYGMGWITCSLSGPLVTNDDTLADNYFYSPADDGS